MINSKSARDAYVRAEVSTFLAHQVRALRNQRGWSQKELAEKNKN
jgi:ribosome-binding protein aMBF1 (putative translation factor)